VIDSDLARATQDLLEASEDAHTVLNGSRWKNGKMLFYFEVKHNLRVAIESYRVEFARVHGVADSIV
jgi:hypothetical protein